MTSVNGDVLACVEEAVPWRDVLPEQSCYREQIDAHATKVATDYIYSACDKTGAECQSDVASAIFECKRRSLEVAREAREAKCTGLFA